jgi:hypothetical protein
MTPDTAVTTIPPKMTPEIGEFHQRDGWYFKRLPDGPVRIRKDELIHIIPANEWESVFRETGLSAPTEKRESGPSTAPLPDLEAIRRAVAKGSAIYGDNAERVLAALTASETRCKTLEAVAAEATERNARLAASNRDIQEGRKLAYTAWNAELAALRSTVSRLTEERDELSRSGLQKSHTLARLTERNEKLEAVIDRVVAFDSVIRKGADGAEEWLDIMAALVSPDDTLPEKDNG